jgi:hypothetical protein
MRMKLALCAATSIGIAVIVASASNVAARAVRQDQSQKPSPPAHAECKFADGASITVDYSSPRMRGRKIYGGLVPFGQVWRAGANDATTFVPSTPVHIGAAGGGLDVPAGSYTLFVIPNESKPWILIVSKQTGEWGIPYPGEQFDLGRTEMGGSALSAPLENFTIGFTPADGNAYLLHMDWEITTASVKITEKK